MQKSMQTGTDIRLIDKKSSQPLLTIDFEKLGVGIVLLALLSIASCVILSLLFNYNEATWTHCNVANYLPSISAATGGFTPQKYIWRIAIALQALPRMGVAFIYFKFYEVSVNTASYKSHWFRILNKVNTALNVVENSALLGLTYISSTENHGNIKFFGKQNRFFPYVHEYCFIIFMGTSMAYMLTNCVLFKWTAQEPMAKEESRSFKWKVGFLLTNYLSFATAVYFFFRHNWHCEPGVYSLFALCEYITITSNIGFHSTVILDCRGRAWVLTLNKEQLQKNI